MKKIKNIEALLVELDYKATHYMDFGSQREKILGIGMKIVLDELKIKFLIE